MLLMIDNYDSFTFNLVQYLQTLGAEVKVVRNDALTVDQIDRLAPERIMISPGPGTPNDAGVSLDVIRELGPRIPVFGVCLGHQTLGQVYGGDVVRAKTIMHGKTSRIRHEGRGVFAGLPDAYEATRYHSLVVAKDTLPDCLEITAWTENEDGELRRDHGPAPSRASGRRRAVPSRVDPHRARPRAAAQLPGTLTMPITPQEALQRTIEHREIFHDEMVELMRAIMRGEVSPTMTAAILTGLRVKKETVGEIAGAATVLREFARPVPVRDRSEPGRHRRHGRRRRAYVQHLHRVDVRRRRGRRARGQARQSQRVVEVGQRGRARSARRAASNCRPSRSPSASSAPASASCSRPCTIRR